MKCPFYIGVKCDSYRGVGYICSCCDGVNECDGRTFEEIKIETKSIVFDRKVTPNESANKKKLKSRDA